MDGHSHPSRYSTKDGSFSPPTTRRRRPQESSLSPPPASAPATTPTPSSRQSRLLRSRNTHFPAKKLSISGISARFSQLIHANNDLVAPRAQSPAQENKTTSKNSLRSVQRFSPSNTSLGILNEVTNNSIGRGISSRKPIPIFEDSPRRPLLDSSPVESPNIYQDASSEISSPVTFDHIRDSITSMRLREVSGNERKSSPLATSAGQGSAQRRRRTTSARNTHKFNPNEYIEHIENELQLVKEAMHSPTTNQPWKEKLKVAKQENDRLNKELTESKMGFEAEVQRTVEQMTQTEVDLRKKIISLEMQLEEKTLVIQERQLQQEESRLDQGAIDSLKSIIDKLEQEKVNLEETNRSINKRNEVLTQLLAASPTRLGNETASPSRPKRNPRPKSMMLVRMPSSPAVGIPSRAQSGLASPALSATCCFSPSSLASEYAMPLSDIGIDPVKLSSVEAPREQSYSVQSTRGSSSRRSTIQSQVSLSPSAWGFPFLTSPTAESKTHGQPSRRKPRRFESGSTSLKPLLLPTLTYDSNGPMSPSRIPLPPSPEKREVSSGSIDPTTAFISPLGQHASADSGSDTYPLEWQFTKRTYHLTDEDELALQSLQCCAAGDDSTLLAADPEDHAASPTPQSQPQGPGESLDSQTYVDDAKVAFPPHLDGPGPQSPERQSEDSFQADERKNSADIPSLSSVDLSRLRELDLPSPHYDSFSQRNTEESPADVPAPLFSPFFDRYTPVKWAANPLNFDHKDSVNLYGSGQSRKRKKSWSSISISSSPLVGKEEESKFFCSPSPSPRLFLVPTSQLLKSKVPQTDPLPASRIKSLAENPHSHLQVLQRRSLGARPLAAVSIQTIYGTLSRYTTYIRELRQDPLALSRRVIARAWITNWKIIGKLSWWVLGLFLGSQSRDSYRSQWDLAKYDASEIAQEICAQSESSTLQPNSRHRTASHSDKSQSQHHKRQVHTGASPTASEVVLVDNNPRKRGWGESLYLWGKFSVAIMLAVGGAIVKGPGEMLKDLEDPQNKGKLPKYHGRGDKNIEQTRLGKPDQSRRFQASNDGNASGCILGENKDELRRRQSRRKQPTSSSRLNEAAWERQERHDDFPDQNTNMPIWHDPDNQTHSETSHLQQFNSQCDSDDTLKPPLVRARAPNLRSLFSEQAQAHQDDKLSSSKTLAVPTELQEHDPESPALAADPDQGTFGS